MRSGGRSGGSGGCGGGSVLRDILAFNFSRSLSLTACEQGEKFLNSLGDSGVCEGGGGSMTILGIMGICGAGSTGWNARFWGDTEGIT